MALFTSLDPISPFPTLFIPMLTYPHKDFLTWRCSAGCNAWFGGADASASGGLNRIGLWVWGAASRKYFSVNQARSEGKAGQSNMNGQKIHTDWLQELIVHIFIFFFVQSSRIGVVHCTMFEHQSTRILFIQSSYDWWQSPISWLKCHYSTPSIVSIEYNLDWTICSHLWNRLHRCSICFWFNKDALVSTVLLNHTIFSIIRTRKL